MVDGQLFEKLNIVLFVLGSDGVAVDGLHESPCASSKFQGIGCLMMEESDIGGGGGTLGEGDNEEFRYPLVEGTSRKHLGDVSWDGLQMKIECDAMLLIMVDEMIKKMGIGDDRGGDLWEGKKMTCLDDERMKKRRNGVPCRDHFEVVEFVLEQEDA
ncbi:hypothetical protein Tco_0434793 [Tanacetum coccineum]